MHSSPRSYKQLQPENRMTIASLKQQNYSIRQIADMLQRSALTVSRELSRNSELGNYTSVSAQQSCHHRRCQSHPARSVRKLHPQSVLFGLVRTLLCSRWTPEQIALTLARLHPKGHRLRASHETIYNCIYAQPVGELRKELVANLRQARKNVRHAAKTKTGAARFLTCTASMFARQRSRTGSFRATGGDTSSKARATPAQWALWSSVPADCSCASSCHIPSLPARPMCCKPSRTSCAPLPNPCARRSPMTMAKRWRCTNN